MPAVTLRQADLSAMHDVAQVSIHIRVLELHQAIADLRKRRSSAHRDALIADYEQAIEDLEGAESALFEMGAEEAEAEQLAIEEGAVEISAELDEAIKSAMAKPDTSVTVRGAARLGAELEALVPGCAGHRTVDVAIWIVAMPEGELRLSLVRGAAGGSMRFRPV